MLLSIQDRGVSSWWLSLQKVNVKISDIDSEQSEAISASSL